MPRYGGFAEMSKAEHQAVCRKSAEVRKLRAKPSPQRIAQWAPTIHEQGKQLVLLRLKRFIREMEKE